jgi:uncharacterized ion transporter superfamily protein YfcC
MDNSEATIRIGKRTFLTAIAILGILMLAAGILTQVVPAGSFDSWMVADGSLQLQPGSYHEVARPDYPVWRWITAPVEVLWSADAPMVLVIIFFILAVAGAVSLLEKSGVLASVIAGIVRRFMNVRYLLLAVVVFFFMLMGAMIGTFEENIALVPILIALAYCLKWDSLVGLGMSILASCFGFTAAITNPFSIAITQKLSGLPLYSGSGFRVLVFIAFYALLMLFLVRYAKRIERNPERSLVFMEDQALRVRYASIETLEEELGHESPEQRHRVRTAIMAFTGALVLVFTVIVGGLFVPVLSELSLPLIALLFLGGSLVASRIAGMGGKRILGILGASSAGIAPGIVLILMAMSVKFIISHGGIMDTILDFVARSIGGTSPFVTVLLIYLLILLLEVFIGSSSAKAFLIMPLVAPLSTLVGITRQTSVLAFSFGDGFSNVLYPTNPVLLICLGLTVVTFPKWFRWTWKLQLAASVLACAFLFIAVAIHYGPQ